MEILNIEKSEDTMIQYTNRHNMRLLMTLAWFVTVIVFTGTGIANGHGGKTHSENPFSAFQAVQKATELYDRLIVSGKLEEGWETDLSSIHVSVRGDDTSRETVVQFERTGGDPDSLYFFFDRRGEYSGSNFTGQ
jgi:hypothetical protein